MTATDTTIAVLGCYLSSAVLLSILAVGLTALVRSGFAARAPERCLAWGFVLLGLALTLPSAWRVAGIAPTVSAPIEIWSGPRLASSGATPGRIAVRLAAVPAARVEAGVRQAEMALAMATASLGFGAAFSLLRLLARQRQLGRFCAAMPLVKRLGRLRLCTCDEAPAPFAARAGGVAFIVVPTSLLVDRARLRMVIAHEAHHHRRGDLRGATILGVVRALFFWNPLLARWERAVAELQDLACDRHVIRRGDISFVEYGRVLLWAAEVVHRPAFVPLGVRGMVDGSGASLRRRILVLNDESVAPGRMGSWLSGLMACAFLVGTSWVVRGAAVDHRVTQAQVDSLGARIERRSGLPVLVDDRVVAQLNEWVADPESRDRMKTAIKRMPNYRAMIERTLQAHGLPVELLAMALAESAFDNEAHPDRPVEVRAAGIWQFIPETARRMGLEVTPALDERLEPGKATEAAAELISRLFSRYGDWTVAIAAYNAGEKRIDGIAAGASSKAEVRARVLSGQDEHARYVRAVMASMILIESPALLD